VIDPALRALAKKNGVDLEKENWKAFRKEALGAWICVRENGEAIAFKGEKLIRLPEMDARVPEELCALGKNETRVVMRREGFDGLYEGMPRDAEFPFAVLLPSEMIWLLLARASSNGVRLGILENNSGGKTLRAVSAR